MSVDDFIIVQYKRIVKSKKLIERINGTEEQARHKTKTARLLHRAAEEAIRIVRKSQDVDVFTGQRLVHAAHGAELAAHAAGVAVVIFRQAGVADGFGGLGVQAHRQTVRPSPAPGGRRPSCRPMSRAWGMPLAMSAAWAAILEATMPCFTSSTLGSARCSAGVT